MHFNTKFLILTFFESLKVLVINVVAILMPVKLATLGLLKIKVMTSQFLSDVTKKVLSRDSDYIIDVVM